MSVEANSSSSKISRSPIMGVVIRSPKRSSSLCTRHTASTPAARRHAIILNRRHAAVLPPLSPAARAPTPRKCRHSRLAGSLRPTPSIASLALPMQPCVQPCGPPSCAGITSRFLDCWYCLAGRHVYVWARPARWYSSSKASVVDAFGNLPGVPERCDLGAQVCL